MTSHFELPFERVFVDRKVKGKPATDRVLRHFSIDQIEWVDKQPLEERKGELSADEFSASKKLLYLTDFKGSFFKRCPGSRPGLTCCNYFVLNLGLQCNMNCSYCYLQSFINTPMTTIYTNIDQALQELDQFARNSSDVRFRIGTGEVIDSLSLDPMTLYSLDLIRYFKDKPNWTLEFKTKSALIDQFIDEPHGGNVIVSWSINPQNIIAAEEFGTAPLRERLQAARVCRDRGYQIAFHIDPMIHHEGWRDSYASLAEDITKIFSPSDMPYISIGGLRFQPEQRHMMRERFGMKSLVTRAEVFPGKDGKMRYDQNLRQEMFDFMIKAFKDRDKAWNIFLCMEAPDTWLNTQMQMPKQDKGIEELFDHRVVSRFRKARGEASW